MLTGFADFRLLRLHVDKQMCWLGSARMLYELHVQDPACFRGMKLNFVNLIKEQTGYIDRSLSFSHGCARH